MLGAKTASSLWDELKKTWLSFRYLISALDISGVSETQIMTEYNYLPSGLSFLAKFHHFRWYQVLNKMDLELD